MFLVMDHLKNIWQLKKWPSLFFVLTCLLNFSLMGDWSSPPEVIYPSSAPYNANSSYIATDGSGNSVAVWFDTTGSGSMQAATLASGAVNGQGQPLWVLTSPVASSNVQDPSNPYAQAVGMNSDGDAMAVWTDGTLVYVATLSAGQSSWSSPTTINTQIGSEEINNLYIAVSSSGFAVVTWSSSVNPYDAKILANVFDSNSQTWRGQTNLLTGAVEYNPSSNPVAIDSQGNAVVAFTQTSIVVQASSYHFSSNTWTQIPQATTEVFANQFVTMDSNGNATLIWQEADNDVWVATLPFNGTSLIHKTNLSTTASVDTSLPIVVADLEGNVVAVWPDISGSLASARYVISGNTWTNLPLLDLGGNIPNLISLSGDLDGNVVASWTVVLDSTSYIQSAVLSWDSSSWAFLSQLSPTSDSDNNSHVILTAEGDAVAIWENDVNEGVGTINSSVFTSLFYFPPSYFTGTMIQNKFFTATDRINVLSWGKSPSLSVVEYRLYRNGALINTQEAGPSTFSYQDHNRSKKVSYTYSLTAVKASGAESALLFVTLP